MLLVDVHGAGIVRRALVDNERSASRVGWVSGVALAGVVTALTVVTRAHELPLALFTATATKLVSGQWWVLPTSALVVDRPIGIGLIAFGILAAATLHICGTRTFWLAAVAGHLGSALVVYAIIGAARLADPHVFTAAAASPDFGVSAIQGAWVGTLTASAWIGARADRGLQAAVAAGVCGLSGIAWWLHPDPSILTTEHLFAFLIGCGIVAWPSLVAATRATASKLDTASPERVHTFDSRQSTPSRSRGTKIRAPSACSTAGSGWSPPAGDLSRQGASRSRVVE